MKTNRTAEEIDAEYENDDTYNPAFPDEATIERLAEKTYAEIGLDYETGLPVEQAAEKFAAEAQDEIDYEKLHSVIYCQVMAERDPRTPAQMADDEQDAQHSRMISDLRQF